MKTITVAELRQNPTQALADVEAGQTYVVTRHRHPVARLVPVGEATPQVVPPRDAGPVRFDEWSERPAATQAEVDEVVEWVKGDR